MSVPEPTTALIAPAAIPAPSSATASHSSIAETLGGAGDHQLAGVSEADAGRLRLAHERAEQRAEPHGIVDVGEVPRSAEQLEAAAGHQLVGADAVVRRDDRVALTPHDLRGHRLGQVQPIAGVDALAPGVDDP